MKTVSARDVLNESTLCFLWQTSKFRKLKPYRFNRVFIESVLFRLCFLARQLERLLSTKRFTFVSMFQSEMIFVSFFEEMDESPRRALKSRTNCQLSGGKIFVKLETSKTIQQIPKTTLQEIPAF